MALRPRLALALVGTAASAILLGALPLAAQNATTGAQAASALVTVESASSFDSTLARLERAAVGKGLTIAARVDHAAAATRAGLTLPPTTLIIAGNPAAGTPLMRGDRTMAVELPLRFLVWRGEDGRTRVTYDPIESIAERHGLRGQDTLLARMTSAIESIVQAATAR